MTAFVTGLYLANVLLLLLFALHRTALVVLYLSHRGRRRALPAPLADGPAPRVLVQLPVYNERYVVERLVDAAAALDWPKDRLTIQVLDDSTDETAERAAAAVRRWRETGLDVRHVRRAHRSGFKAGALAHGLALAPAPFVAVFDADFQPPADFLRRTLPVLLEDEGVALVQARWTHSNRRQNLLCRLQAILLDGHFVLEHGARFRSGRFFNFNGTAGVWRTAAIEAAGGWQGDTLCEDLDLSYRAQLAGWRFVYLQDLAVPAELPADAASFKSQQHRWAKGSIEVARKVLPALVRSALPWRVKLEGAVHLLGNLGWLLVPPLLVLLPWAAALGDSSTLRWQSWMLLASAANLALFYGVAEQQTGERGWGWRLPLLPLVMALGAGLSLSSSRAVLSGLLGRRTAFVRTPKGGGRRPRRYLVGVVRSTLADAGLAALALTLAVLHPQAAPILLLLAVGLLTLVLGRSIQPGSRFPTA